MPTTRRPTAAELIAKLDLAPNQTCGFVRVTYTSDLQLHDALPAPLDGTRPLGTALIFLVTPEAPEGRRRRAEHIARRTRAHLDWPRAPGGMDQEARCNSPSPATRMMAVDATVDLAP